MAKNKKAEIVFSILIIASLVIGWQQREEYWLTAEKGWGYALGIIGGSMMLILLLYPLRKHWKVARQWFPIYHWFRMHMIFGILGPLLILFHSNFHLGSLNSQIALFAMLLVASSGLIGRYAYSKIHRGLYGKQIEFGELQQAFNESKSHFAESEYFDVRLEHKLEKIETCLNKRQISLMNGLMSLRHVKTIEKVIKAKSRIHAKQLLKQPEKLKIFTEQTRNLNTGLKHLRQMASYSTYAKVFSYWHVFHMPVFFMMIIAAVVHVFVVHIY